MPDIIAREDYVKNISGKSCSAYVANRAIDRAQVTALGVGYRGTYAAN